MLRTSLSFLLLSIPRVKEGMYLVKYVQAFFPGNKKFFVIQKEINQALSVVPKPLEGILRFNPKDIIGHKVHVQLVAKLIKYKFCDICTNLLSRFVEKDKYASRLN